MDNHKQAAKSSKKSSVPQTARSDKKTAEIVRKGITLQQIHGTEYAAQFLKEKNVEIEVILRVLMNCATTRRYDDLLEVEPEATSSHHN